MFVSCVAWATSVVNAHPLPPPHTHVHNRYSGGEGVYSYTFEYQRNTECCACNVPRRVWDLPGSTTVQAVIDRLREAIDLCVAWHYR